MNELVLILQVRIFVTVWLARFASWLESWRDVKKIRLFARDFRSPRIGLFISETKRLNELTKELSRLGIEVVKIDRKTAEEITNADFPNSVIDELPIEIDIVVVEICQRFFRQSESLEIGVKRLELQRFGRYQSAFRNSSDPTLELKSIDDCKGYEAWSLAHLALLNVAKRHCNDLTLKG